MHYKYKYKYKINNYLLNKINKIQLTPWYSMTFYIRNGKLS